MTRALHYHFSGIAGAGMNPLAQLMRARGHDVQGSDRSFDHGKSQDVAARLRGLGIALHPQDGSAVTAGLDRFVYSTAVEDDTPEMRAARTLGIERIARPALLAEIVNGGEARRGGLRHERQEHRHRLGGVPRARGRDARHGARRGSARR